MMETVLENALIQKLAENLPRSPVQLNRVYESDAELFRIPGTELVLAWTTDGLVEEIEAGLYADPYLIGWMTVVVNGSDLAAVGATPIGMLISQTLRPDLDDGFLAELQRGVREAAEACHLPVLGGDTNFSERMQMTATALGIVKGGRPLTRRGCRNGDHLFASGPLGLGGAYALTRLDDRFWPLTVKYQPLPRLREASVLRRFASCAMDSSDGPIATLDELMRLNGLGFRLERPVEQLLHPAARALCEAAQLPHWMMLAGPHGEFELLFAVAPDRRAAFLERATGIGWQPLELGVVTGEAGLRISVDGSPATLDTTRVRNLFLECRGDPSAYLQALMRMNDALTSSARLTSL